MICSYCATEMPEISAFCPRCGRSVEVEEFAETNQSAAADTRDTILGAVAYVGLVPAIVFLLVPPLKNSRFIRFHAWQSIFFAVGAAIMVPALRLLFIIFSLLPFIGFLLAWLSLGIGFLGAVTLWAVLIAKAAQGHSYELPVLGPIAARLAG